MSTVMTNRVIHLPRTQVVLAEEKQLIYLATPFSHKCRWAMKLRWSIVTALAAKLVKEGHHVFSPITESHCIDDFGLAQSGWSYWAEHDCMMIDKCDEVWVATLPGWKDSVGVTAEIKHALFTGKPVRYLDVHDYLPELRSLI